MKTILRLGMLGLVWGNPPAPPPDPPSSFEEAQEFKNLVVGSIDDALRDIQDIENPTEPSSACKQLRRNIVYYLCNHELKHVMALNIATLLFEFNWVRVTSHYTRPKPYIDMLTELRRDISSLC